MQDIFRSYSNVSLLSLIVGIGFLSCTNFPLKDVAADDLSDLSIDPDQPAIPADASGGTSGGSDPQIKTDAVSAEQSNRIDVVPPTPKIEELEGERASAEDTPVEPEPPIDQSMADSGKDLSRFGSGPQVRYIKAAELNVREKPDRYSKIVGVLKGGDKVRVKVKGGWAKLDEGRWIRSRWLIKQRPSGIFSQGDDPEDFQSVKQKSGKKHGRKSKRNKKS